VGVDIILTLVALVGVGVMAAFHVGLSRSHRTERSTSPLKRPQTISDAALAATDHETVSAQAVATGRRVTLHPARVWTDDMGNTVEIAAVGDDAVAKLVFHTLSAKEVSIVEGASAVEALKRLEAARDRLAEMIVSQSRDDVEDAQKDALARVKGQLTELMRYSKDK
jgi:hypothetical protein